jgi:hypothetical protein
VEIKYLLKGKLISLSWKVLPRKAQKKVEISKLNALAEMVAPHRSTSSCPRYSVASYISKACRIGFP